MEPEDGMIRLRVFVDQSSVEVYSNGGIRALTAVVFPPREAGGIGLFPENRTAELVSMDLWEVDSVW